MPRLQSRRDALSALRGQYEVAQPSTVMEESLLNLLVKDMENVQESRIQLQSVVERSGQLTAQSHLSYVFHV